MLSRASRSPRADRSGFTIFEAVVAMLIVGLTSIAAMHAVATELRTQFVAQRMIEAQSLAASKMGMIELLTAEELQLLPDSIREGHFDPPLDNYRWTTTAQSVDNEDYVNDVALRIDWTDGSYTLRTLLYRPSAFANTAGAGRAGGGG